MRKLFLFLIAAMPVVAQAAGFESLPLPAADTYYVNYTLPGKDVGFNEYNVHFPCVYDTAFGGYWVSGFAYSNKRDSSTSGFINQYSAKPGAGHNGSATYIVANGQVTSVKRLGARPWFYSMSITNSTYAYNSMRSGDAFGKKFGGPTGNDPDWFKVTIRGYQNKIPTDSSDFYLADFRFANKAQDYIVKDWQLLNLTEFTNSDSLTFTLSSSDTGSFGINTPLYFCLDDLLMWSEGVENIAFSQMATIAPNPVADFLQLDVKDASVTEAAILDVTGKLIAHVPVRSNHVVIGTSAFPAGQYLLRLAGKSGTAVAKFIRQ